MFSKEGFMIRKITQTMLLIFVLTACGSPTALPPAARTAPAQPAQPVLVASPMPTLIPAAATPGKPVEDPVELMLFSHTRWSSLGADYTITDYAGDPANTPVMTTRTQVWLEQPGKGRLLSGPIGGAPVSIWLGDGKQYQSTGELIMDLPDLAGLVLNPPPPGSDTVYPHPLAGLLGSRLGDYIFSTPLAQRGGEYRLVGREELAGRPVVVVEYFRDINDQVIDRFWIDSATGVILRAINFGKGGGGVMTSQIVATQVQFDIDLDDSLFVLGSELPAQFSPGP
jgi:hypothetical protein